MEPSCFFLCDEKRAYRVVFMWASKLGGAVEVFQRLHDVVYFPLLRNNEPNTFCFIQSILL